MIGRVTKEDARKRSWSEFVGRCWVGVWITQATENAEAIVIRRGTIEKLKRGDELTRATWATVNEKRGRGEGLRPKDGGHAGMKEKRAHGLVEGA